MYIAIDIPRAEFTDKENISVYMFPKDKRYFIAPSGQRNYYSITGSYDMIEFPDHIQNKDKFLASLLYAYWNADQLTALARELREQIKNPPSN